MGGTKPLHVPRRLEPLHDPLSSPRRLVGILCPVVQAFVLPALDAGHDLTLGRSAAAELVGDQHAGRSPLLLQKLAEQAFGGLLVAPALDDDIENKAFLVDRALQSVLLAGDGEDDFVKCLHVARPHLPPVDAVGAAHPASEQADHLHFEQPGERRGKAATRQRQRHRGVAVAGAGGGAGEDEVVHLRTAQRPGVPLAHRPAQRVGDIALAAAIGSDDAGKAGQDGELYRIGEALEAGDAQLGEVHGHAQPHHGGVVGGAGAPRPALLKGGTRRSLDQPRRA